MKRLFGPRKKKESPKNSGRSKPWHETLGHHGQQAALQGAIIAEREAKERGRSGGRKSSPSHQTVSNMTVDQSQGSVTSTQSSEQQVGHPPSLLPGPHGQQIQIRRRPVDGTDPRSHWKNSSTSNLGDSSGLVRTRANGVAELEAPMQSTSNLVSSAASGSTRLIPSPYDSTVSYTAYTPTTPPLTAPFSMPSHAGPQPKSSGNTTQLVELSAEDLVKEKLEATRKNSSSATSISNSDDCSSEDDKKGGDQSLGETSGTEKEGDRDELVVHDKALGDATLMEQINDLLGSANGGTEDSGAESTCAVVNGDGADEDPVKGKISCGNLVPENEKGSKDSEQAQELPIHRAKSPPTKLQEPNSATATPPTATDNSTEAPSPPVVPSLNSSDTELRILRSQCPEIPTEKGVDLEAYVKLLLTKYIYLRNDIEPIRQAAEGASSLRIEITTLSEKLRRRDERLQAKRGELTMRSAENVGLKEQVMQLENERRDLEATYKRQVTGLQEKNRNSEEMRKQLVLRHDKALSDSWNTQQERHELEKANIEEDSKKEIRRLIKIHSEELDAQQASLTKDLEAVRQQLNQERDSIARERSAWDRKWRDREAEHARKISETKAQHQEVVNGLQSEIITNSKEWQAFHDKEMKDSQTGWLAKEEGWGKRFTSMSSAHQEELATIASKHQRQLSDHRAQLESRISEQARQYNHLKRTSEEEKKSIQDTADRTLKETEERYKATIKSLKDEHESKLKQSERVLRNHNEKLKRALVQREHVKGLTDPQVEGLFQRLEIQLIDFSKMIKWDLNKQTHWPTQENAFQEYVNSDGSTSAKRLKQYVVLSCVWALLHDNIFCSPFQIFGEAGDEMHDQWTEKFGKDSLSRDFSDWPEPSPKSEKMRYDTIKQWKEGLQQQSSIGANGNRKECFEKSLDATVQEISEAITRVASMSVREQEHLKNLVKAAADNWLEICSQRYRVLVVLPNEDGNILTPGWKKTRNALNLIARPEVRRIGNSQGQELEREEIIGDWTGSVNVWKRR